jgi:hypothetical protein
MIKKINFKTLQEESTKAPKKIYKFKIVKNESNVEKIGKNNIVLKLEKKEFSLKNDIKNDELILNSNILDSLKQTKNDNILLNSIFDSEIDPIYDIDEAVEMNKSSIKSEEQKIKEKQVNLYLQNSRLRTTRGIY